MASHAKGMGKDPSRTYKPRVAPFNAAQWAAVRADYAVNRYPSLRALALAHGIDEAALRHKRAREPARWVLAPAEVVNKLSAQLMDNALVRGAMLEEVKAEIRAEVKTDMAIIHSLARQQADIILAERKDISGLMNTVAGMFAELEASSFTPEELSKIAELKALIDTQQDAGDVSVHLASLKKLVSLGNRAKIAKDLSDVLKTLIGLRRQAFGIADNANGEANQPEEREQTPNEIAREIAFAMNKLEYQDSTIEGEFTATK